jgi:Tfp pilus assembly protein PilF
LVKSLVAARNAYGSALQQSGRLDALDPSLLEAELALADIYVTQGRRSEAAGALRRALSVAEAKGRDEIAATLRVALAQLDDRRP